MSDDLSEAFPVWVDAELSKQLPIMRDAGEGQAVEFMRQYPENGHELAKEIAAFASSNTGIILIGVDNDGSLVGLTEIDNLEKRDALCRRLEGLCHGNIKPAITPVVKFLQENGKTVLAIQVPHGMQPLYYSKNIPYVRHLSQSRPAEPHEVIELITNWLGTTGDQNPEEQFFSSLASVLVEIIIAENELGERRVNPWLDGTLLTLRTAAPIVRDLALEDIAIRKKVDERLKKLAEFLENASLHRALLGGEAWRDLVENVSEAANLAWQIKKEFIDPKLVSPEQERRHQEQINKITKHLSDLAVRADKLINGGRIEEVQHEASEIGHRLLILTHYLPEMSGSEVQQIAKALHLIETERLYADGGQSMGRVLNKVRDLSARLAALVTNRASSQND